MSTEVDSRIVEMKFDSKDFEKNAQSTLSMLDKLKAKLNFSDTKESFNSFDTSKLRKELDKINEFDGGKFESVFDRLEYRMSNMGIFTSRIVENIADDIYSMVKKAMDNIGKVVTFAEQGIVQGGYNRAANIQSAKFQLEGLGIKWSEIYGDIDYAVTNTAYSLDQAAIVSSQLASSGIKPGSTWKDLSGKEQDIDYMAMILRSISGTASATGGKADYADIGRIFTKMISYGKVYTQNLNELATYGIGAKGIVADYLNQIKYKGSNKWTEQRVQDVMSDRQGGGLDPQIVIEAFFNKFADHATAANETLTGVTANLRAALARIGEKFFEPIIQNGGPLVKLIDALRISINDLNKVIGPIAESFGKYIGGLIEKFTDNWFFETTTDPETGEKKRTMKLGGIFSSFMEPWKESEWLPTHIGEGERRQGLTLPKEYLQNYETRAQKIAGNLRDIVQNIVSIVTGVGKLFKSAFKGAADGGFSLAAVLVTITNFLNKLTKTIADFINSPEFVHSGIYIFFRFLADSVRIMISFAKSFKKHIIDPIFNAGKAAASASGVGSWFRDLFDRIHNFSLKLREEGNEDYFGPFLEKIKAGAKAVKEKLSDLFGGIGTTVKNGMRDIIDWWKPIKDIIFDTDLGFKDKMAAIKQYFSENFELPGWSKVKDIFGGIADAVGKAFNAVKKFLGFGGKKNEGIPNPDEYELVASKHDFGGVLGIKSELDKADKSTEKLTTIGDRLSNFFSKVGEAFSNVDLGGIKGVTLALLAIVVLLAVGIALAVKKVLDSMKKLVINFPKLASDILKSFQGVMDEVAAMFKAKKYEIYTQALKNIAIATAMLTAVFVGLAGIIAIVDHFGGGDAMADGLKQAGIVIAGIAGSLTVMLAAIIAVTNLTGSGGGYALGISKSGLTASAPSASLAAVAAIIKSFVDGIIALAAVVVVLGALSYIPGLLDNGFNALDKIVLRLSVFILGVISLVGVINLLAAWNHEFKSGKTWIAGNQNAFAKSLASIAGILMSIVAGVLILTPVIAVLGILSKVGLFDLGIDALMHITGWLTLTTGALLIIVAVISKAGQLDGKRIAGAIFGLAAVMTAVALGVLAFSAAMVIVSQLDGSGFAKSVFAFLMIAAALIGIPAALMGIYNHMSKANLLRFDNKVLGSMTLMVLAIGASVLAMSIGLRAAASSDPVSLLITVAGIAGIFGTIAAVMYNLARFNNGGLTKAAITIGVMGGVIIALNTMLIILSHHLTTNMLIAGAIMIGEVILLAGAIFGLAKFLNRFGTGLNFTGLVQFAGAMALVAASILPISAALYIVMAAVGGFGMNVGQIVASMGGMALLVGILALSVTHMLTSFGDQRIKPRTVSAMVASILSVSAGVALIGGAIAAILAAINATEISEGGAVFTILAFAGVIVAFGFAMKMLLESSMKVKDVKKVILPLAVAVASIVVPIGLIAGAIALLSQLPMSGVIAGGSVLGGLSIVIFVLSQVTINMSRKLRMSKNLLAKLGITLGAYAALCLAMIPLAGALRMIAKIGTGDLIKAGTALSIMGGAVLVLTGVIAIIGNKTINVAGVLATMGAFTGISIGLYVMAAALHKLSTFNFEDIKANLWALGGIVILALGVVAIVALVSTTATGAMAAAGALLGVAVVMASVGVLLWLAADALDKFVDVLLKIDGKTATITRSLTGLLTGIVSAIGAALKKAIIGLANAISDPEIRNAISDAVTGILTWVRDNIGVWTKLIIQIAANFVKAIVDAIDLYEIGKFLDEKFLGGTISTTVDILVETNMNIKKADMLGGLYDQYSKAFMDVSRVMGYTQAQWDRMYSTHGSKIKGIMDYIIEGYNFGNEEIRQRIEEFGGLGAFMRSTLEEFYSESDINPKPRTELEAQKQATNEFVSHEMDPTFSYLSQEQRMRLNLAGGLAQQALKAGWDETDEGNRLKTLAENEFAEIIAIATKKYGENSREVVALKLAAKKLGLDVKTKTKEGLYDGSMPLADWLSSQNLTLANNYGLLTKDVYDYNFGLIKSAYDGQQDGLSEFFPDGTTAFILQNQKYASPLKEFYTTPAPYRKTGNKTIPTDPGSALMGRGPSGTKTIIDPEYKSALDKWLGSNNPFNTIDLRQMSHNVATMAEQLKQSGLTIEDVEAMYGKDAAKYYSQYFIGASSSFDKGYRDLNMIAQIGLSSLNKTMSTGNGGGGASEGSPFRPKLAYFTLSNVLDADYFNPLGYGMNLGYRSVANGGINVFTSTMNTAGSVLGASRPYVESSILSGFINPLGAFMQAGGTTDGNMYKNSLLTVLNAGFTVKPRVSVVPEINMAGNSFMEGLGMGSSMTNPIVQYINQSMGLNDVYTSPFRWSGEMITAGLMYGMQDSTARKNVKENTKTLSMTVVNYIKQAFKIHSPAKDEELIWASEMVVAGFSNNLTNSTSEGYIKEGTDNLADSTGEAMNQSMSGIDMSSVGEGLSKSLGTGFNSSILDGFDIGSVAGKLKNAITEKLPTWGFIKSQFGWDKGISGNIQGLKNVWGSIKDAFSGGLDLEGILKDSGLDVSKFTAGLNLENMGFSISANDIIDMQGINNEFAGFDVNDYTTNTDLSVKLDLDTSMADDWLKQNQSIDMATSIPVTGGYERSTTGSATYVNNYSFNQNNTSPQALSARDTARYAELMLNRRLGWRAQ
jgi:hypothetical protein